MSLHPEHTREASKITTPDGSPKPNVARITVKDLFGLYSYDLPPEGTLGSAAILYGDNGSGKTTLLKLAFNLLSPAPNRGHRTAIYETPFSLFAITLSDGTLLSVERPRNQLNGRCLLKIQRDNGSLATWDYESSRRNKPDTTFGDFYVEIEEGVPVVKKKKKASTGKQNVEGEDVYLTALKRITPDSFFLSADRQLSSDVVPDPSDEVELRRLLHYEEPKRIHELVIRGRQIALSQAIGSAAKWLAKKTIEGTNLGTTNVNSVYRDIVKRLEKPTRKLVTATPDQLTANSLQERLQQLSQRTDNYAKYELATAISITDFVSAVKTKNPARRQLIQDVLKPYIEGLEARLNALAEIYQTTARFVDTINSFLVDKQLMFGVATGFKILNARGIELEPRQLSSGEQQLFLLFCHVLVSRDKTSLFIIDEPEISLNEKWQRRLVQSLLEVTANTNIQFLFASHSVELLAQHSDKVVRLPPRLSV